MKKLLLLVPFLILSCKKDSVQTDQTFTLDSTKPAPAELHKSRADSLRIKDSLIANSPTVEKVLDEGVNRKLTANEIVRTADGIMLPFTIGDEITDEDQKFVLLLKNVTKPELKITVEGKKKMNLRINQIQNPDGSMDGPFGQSYTYKTPQKGEYKIILGKNLMAEGSGKGHFTLKVE